MSPYYVEITINPVQEFISKVRKMRDLWSGSFLLSYLSASMLVAIEGRAKVVSPYVDFSKNDLILMKKGEGSKPKFGSLPHFFKLELDGGEKEAISLAREVENAFTETWEEIADFAYNMLPRNLMGERQRNIWERQTNSFWTLNWVASESLGMDKYSKLNRISVPPAEDWIGCTMFGELADISGEFKNKKRKEFWSQLRNAYRGNKSDFGEDEWLSAIGVIKRLFPHYLKKKYGLDMLGYPSTTYFAVYPWLMKIDEQIRENGGELGGMADEFVSFVRKHVRQPFEGSQEPGKSEFMAITSDAFYPDSIDNLDFLEERDTLKQELRNRLKLIYKKVGEPGTFYTILLMDGDKLGKLFAESEDFEDTSKKLGEFAEKVPDIVEKNDGRLIYAGGDDVLAILPINTALKCARGIKEEYDRTLEKRGTISAGIVLSHHKLPLRVALQEAHHLLDEVAKDENGRSSFAVSIMFPSTTTHVWVSTWEDEKGKNMIGGLEDLLEKIEIYRFSNSFFYKTLSLLERFDIKANKKSLPHILTAEYYATRDSDGKEKNPLKDRDEIFGICEGLMDMCKRRYNGKPNKEEYNIEFIRILKFFREIAKERKLDG